MGNPTEANQQADALAAAELKVAAEDARARLLAGDSNVAEIEQIIRLEHLADRAVRKLGLDDRKREPPPGTTLGSILRQGIERQQQRGGKTRLRKNEMSTIVDLTFERSAAAERQRCLDATVDAICDIFRLSMSENKRRRLSC